MSKHFIQHMIDWKLPCSQFLIASWKIFTHASHMKRLIEYDNLLFHGEICGSLWRSCMIICVCFSCSWNNEQNKNRWKITNYHNSSAGCHIWLYSRSGIYQNMMHISNSDIVSKCSETTSSSTWNSMFSSYFSAVIHLNILIMGNSFLSILFF